MQRLKRVIVFSILGVGALLWSGVAEADDWRWNLVSPNDSQMTVHKDFSLVPPPALGHTFVDHLNQAFQPGNPVNYQSHTFQGGTAGRCLEISTASSGTSADTRFWATDVNGNFKSLNDDSGGTLFSRARYWVAPGTVGLLYVAAFSSFYDNMEFFFTVLRINATEAACTTGQGLPWFKTNGSQFSANAS